MATASFGRYLEAHGGQDPLPLRDIDDIAVTDAVLDLVTFIDTDQNKRVFLPELATWMLVSVNHHMNGSRNASDAEFSALGTDFRAFINNSILYF